MKTIKVLKLKVKPKTDFKKEQVLEIVKEIKNGWVFHPDKGWRIGK